MPRVCDGIIYFDQSSAVSVHILSGLSGRHSQAGKNRTRVLPPAGREPAPGELRLGYRTLVPQHTEPARLSLLFFFLVIKTSSSSQTPQYIIRCACLHLGDRSFMSQRNTRSLGAATNRCWKCPFVEDLLSQHQEQALRMKPLTLQECVCVLRGAC